MCAAISRDKRARKDVAVCVCIQKRSGERRKERGGRGERENPIPNAYMYTHWRETARLSEDMAVLAWKYNAK